MQFNITQEMVNEMSYDNIIIRFVRSMVSYAQPRICKLITVPIQVNFDMSSSPKCTYGINAMGSMCFGTMMIYLQNLKNYMKEYYYMNDVIIYLAFLVCHELYHVDQVTDNDRYITDVQYNWYIESAVNYSAIQFLDTNAKDISKLMNVSDCEYSNLFERLKRNELSYIYKFCNTFIEKRTLDDVYIEYASFRLNQDILDKFAYTLKTIPTVYIAVSFLYDGCDNTIDDNILSECIIKENGFMLPIDESIIETMDYAFGARSSYTDGDISSCIWYSNVIDNIDTNESILLIVRDFSSYNNKLVGFNVVDE